MNPQWESFYPEQVWCERASVAINPYFKSDAWQINSFYLFFGFLSVFFLLKRNIYFFCQLCWVWAFDWAPVPPLQKELDLFRTEAKVSHRWTCWNECFKLKCPSILENKNNVGYRVYFVCLLPGTGPDLRARGSLRWGASEEPASV